MAAAAAIVENQDTGHRHLVHLPSIDLGRLAVMVFTKQAGYSRILKGLPIVPMDAAVTDERALMELGVSQLLFC